MKFRSVTVLASLAVLFTSYFLIRPINATSKILIDRNAMGQDSLKVWIFFTDKGEAIGKLAKSAVASEAATSRRLKRGTVADPSVYDREVSGDYLAQVEPHVLRFVHETRWLNGVSAWVRPTELDEIAQLSCVTEIRSVTVYRRKIDQPIPDSLQLRKSSAPYPPEYGPSFHQMNQIQVPALHDLGFHGEGVRILILDTGFRVDHPVFDGTDIEATYDFINKDLDVSDEIPTPAQRIHGTQTLSVLGANAPYLMLGVAYKAKFWLAKTEIVTQEIQAEEDNWVAAIEWGEIHGVDVASSSLGYTGWYDYAEKDGNTAVTTKAADLAASLGVMVVNAIGNEQRISPEPTLIAPSDGDSVIAVGAVYNSGETVYFSSNGPAADGRIKPDLCAQGVDDVVASPFTDELTTASGTSFSTPLVAGAVALLVQAKPDWKYGEIYQALTATASRALEPDTVYGYGVVRAQSALNYKFDGPANIRGVAAYPNPFEHTIQFDFEQDPAGEVEIRIYTAAGEKVVTLHREAGDPAPLTWDGRNGDGKEAAAGVYVAYISADGVSEMRKIFKRAS